MKKTAHGKIFALPLPDGTYLFGRVMLEVMPVLKRRLLPYDSPLLFYSDTYLVEMYSATAPRPEYVPSPILIPAAFVGRGMVGRQWPVVGQRPVDPRTVAFPETLSGWGHSEGEGAFQSGEIRYPVPFTEDDVQRRIRVLGSWTVPAGWADCCLWPLGHRKPYAGEFLLHSDLRFSPQHRAEVYKHLPFSMEMSYFEKQAQLGLHLERFYE